ncbi:hypothetical protein FHG87_007828 [Trinorchestia longiramus]|nr:hypothetical protein FHG87_007828 [Trinorchestia longiramus]
MTPEKSYFLYGILLLLTLSSAGVGQECGPDSDCVAVNGITEHPAIEGSPCLDPRCSCDDGFFFDPDTKSCLQELGRSRRRRNATEENPGKTVGGACLTEADCLDGLRCSSGECQCPEDCSYDAGLLACDCGADEFSSLPLIIVAVVWAPINIFIWYKCFKSAREGRRKNRTEDGGESPSKVALHSNPLPQPTVVGSAQTETNTHLASAEQPGHTDPTPDEGSSASQQRPVFVVSTDETQLPIDPRQGGVFTPPGPPRGSAPSDAWKDSPRVN